MGWKSDTSLATQNKNDDLSDNIDNIDDNLKQLFFHTKIRSYLLATKIFKNNDGYLALMLRCAKHRR